MRQWGRFALSFLLSVTMALGMCPTQGFAEDDVVVEVATDGEDQDAQIQVQPEGEDGDEAAAVEEEVLLEPQSESVVTVTIEEDGQPTQIVEYSDFVLALWLLNAESTVNRRVTLRINQDTSVDERYNQRFAIRQHRTTVDLNGHTVDMGNHDLNLMSSEAYKNRDLETLAIKDSQGGGVLDNCNILVGATSSQDISKLIIEGGTINGDIRVGDAKEEGAYVAYRGNVSIKNGTINGNVIVQTKQMGTFVPSESSLNMSGGVINGSVSMQSSFDYCPARFTMTGGTIANASGLGVDMGENSVFTMSGGTVTGCAGGGVRVNASGTLSLSGIPVIAGNTAGNVLLPAGQTVSVTGSLASGANVGVTTATKPTTTSVVPFTNGYKASNPGADPASFFTSDYADCFLTTNESGEAALKVHQHDWRYTADGNVLQAACRGTDWNRGGCAVGDQMLTLRAADKTYDGSPADVTIQASVGWTTANGLVAVPDVAKVTYYEGGVALGAAPTAAGDYVAELSVPGAGSNGSAATIRTSFSIFEPPALPESVATTAVAHVQKKGTMKASTGVGGVIGTTGKSCRLESLRLSLSGQPLSGGIEYRAHVQKVGWQSWKDDGQMAGTQGRSRRMEALQVRLTGQMAERYDVYYRVHAQRYGWMAWAKNGAKAGTTGMSRRAEAVQVVVVRKGASTPGKTYNGAAQTYGKAFVRK